MIRLVSSSRAARSPSCRTHGCVSVTTATLKGVHVQKWKRHVCPQSAPPFPTERVMGRSQSGCVISWRSSPASAMGDGCCSAGTAPRCGCLSTGCGHGRLQPWWGYFLHNLGTLPSKAFPMPGKSNAVVVKERWGARTPDGCFASRREVDSTVIDRPRLSHYDGLHSGGPAKTTCTGQEGRRTYCVTDTRRKGHDQP